MFITCLWEWYHAALVASDLRGQAMCASIRASGLGASLVVAAVVAGCSNVGQYLDRRDTVTMGAGDAVRNNIVAQVIDPWPAYVWNQNIPMEGSKGCRVYRRYVTRAPDRDQSTQSGQASGQGASLIQLQTNVNTGGEQGAAQGGRGAQDGHCG